jgi:cytochrome c5
MSNSVRRSSPARSAARALCALLLSACAAQREAAPVAAPPLAAPASTPARAIDAATGFVIDDGMEVVAATCTVCHSSKLVIQNRGTRRDWEELLRWMQKNHNLWTLDESVRATILDYLTRNYAPEAPRASFRRPPLPQYLLPPEGPP